MVCVTANRSSQLWTAGGRVPLSRHKTRLADQPGSLLSARKARIASDQAAPIARTLSTGIRIRANDVGVAGSAAYNAIQSFAATDIALTLADVSTGSPLAGTRSVAGPEVFALDNLGRTILEARGDHRTVVTDQTAGMFAAVPGDALLPEPRTLIATTSLAHRLTV